MNNGNFKDEVFKNVSGVISCSNFENCVFMFINNQVVFDRCNLKNCRFNKTCKFKYSNVTNTLNNKQTTNILSGCAFENSNYITEEPEEHRPETEE